MKTTREELDRMGDEGTLSNMFVFEAVARGELTPEEAAQILMQMRDMKRMSWLSRLRVRIFG